MKKKDSNMKNRNERGLITTDTTELQRDYYEDTNKLGNLEEMNTF